jgi:hypothetical protein
MIVYCVTILVDSNIVDDWRTWMQEVHIPEVLATGYFADHQFLEQTTAEGPNQSRFQIQYFCYSEKELNRYWAERAPALQSSHTARYSGRFQASRAVFRKIE